MNSIKNSSAIIIDDEPDICFLLKNLLIRNRFDVEIAHTLREGLLKIGENSPQLLFLDINLPDGSGLDLLQTIRHDHPGLKIIIISAHDGALERKQATENGANAYLSKPLSVQTVLDAIN